MKQKLNHKLKWFLNLITVNPKIHVPINSKNTDAQL